MPAGAVSPTTNDPADASAVVSTLTEHPDTAHINFTPGSTRGWAASSPRRRRCCF